jgi:hypothetical protein
MVSRKQLTELMKAGILLNEDEVESYLGKGKNTLAIARSRGNPVLPYIRVGRSVRYDPVAIAKFIANNTVEPKPRAPQRASTSRQRRRKAVSQHRKASKRAA